MAAPGPASLTPTFGRKSPSQQAQKVMAAPCVATSASGRLGYLTPIYFQLALAA